ncbi:MAG: pantoate--beta-alanine ligase [Chloroflexota bacterium]|nr:pantoate--beta-alanine ligase [Chloroflexota bacterium]MDE2840168.1 pantoate--beta-alanine ligase [Chloroflexota bacterium]MDE2931871.1 pantoate--beta-alanine ligase [Chloroflexota bacterium]
MQILHTIPAVRAARQEARGSLGLVPTMGYLHAGHMALVRAARDANDHCWATVFVNSLQFGQNEDFNTYPRDLPRDLALFEEAGVDAVFVPEAETMYTAEFSTYVDVEKLTDRLEGAARPGHFRGVTTVVCKLLNIVQPHRVYLGRKDAQQLRVIRRMVRDLNIPTTIVPVETVREPDGLAHSSRNVHLKPAERQAANALYQALQAAQQGFVAGERNADVLRAAMRAVLAREPLLDVEYVSVADDESLEALTTIERPALASLAARIGTTRLIDAIELGSDSSPSS